MTQTLLFFPAIGGPELLLIVLVIFLLFGATRLPQLAKALGQSKKAFREGIDEGEREDTVKKVEKSA
jgi:sec-independent protein translocase protein TatA